MYKTKLNKDEQIDKYKTHWIAKDFQQKYNIDYIETFSNMIKLMIFRALFAFATYNDMKIQQWNIKSIFFNADINEEINVMQFIDYEENLN